MIVPVEVLFSSQVTVTALAANLQVYYAYRVIEYEPIFLGCDVSSHIFDNSELTTWGKRIMVSCLNRSPMANSAAINASLFTILNPPELS